MNIIIYLKIMKVRIYNNNDVFAITLTTFLNPLVVLRQYVDSFILSYFICCRIFSTLKSLGIKKI